MKAKEYAENFLISYPNQPDMDGTFTKTLKETIVDKMLDEAKNDSRKAFVPIKETIQKFRSFAKIINKKWKTDAVDPYLLKNTYFKIIEESKVVIPATILKEIKSVM